MCVCPAGGRGPGDLPLEEGDGAGLRSAGGRLRLLQEVALTSPEALPAEGSAGRPPHTTQRLGARLLQSSSPQSSSQSSSSPPSAFSGVQGQETCNR